MTTQNSQPILQCVLSNGAHPEYGQAMVPFPIPAGHYGRTLALLPTVEGVENATTLTVNGGTADVEIQPDEAPTAGTVEVTA